MARALGYIEHGTGKHQSNIVWDIRETSPTITTLKDGGTQQIKVLVGLTMDGNKTELLRQDKTRQDKTRQDKTRQDKEYVGIKVANKRGFIECEIGGVADFLYPTSKHRRGRVQGGGQISPTITAENTGVCRVELNENYLSPERQKEIDEENEYYEYLFGERGVIYPNEDITKGNEVDWENCEYRIRKLTPKECYRLMDVSEEDAVKMLAVNSATQCYKTAGNSIIVSVLCAVLSQLNIQGIKPWNDRTLEEQYDLTALGRKQ